MALWLLGPDPAGNCCDCAGMTSPCDSCDGGTCRSKSGALQSVSCDDEAVTTWTVDEDQGVGYHTNFTFNAVSNGDGTWTVTLVSLSITHFGVPYSDPYLCGPLAVSPNMCVSNLANCDGASLQWRPGDSAVIDDCGFFGGNPSFCAYGGIGQPLFLTEVVIIRAGGWNDERTAQAAAAFVAPYDTIPNCEKAYTSSIDESTGLFQFNYNQQKLTLTGLTVDQTYCLLVYFVSRPYGSGGAWTAFSTLYIIFTATSATELTDWLDAFNGGSSPSMNGLEVKLDHYTLSTNLGDCPT